MKPAREPAPEFGHRTSMTREAQELFDLAVALPASERAALVVRLLDSITAPGAAAAAQSTESLDRIHAARAGSLDILDDESTVGPY